MLCTMFVFAGTKLTIKIQMKKVLKSLIQYPLYILSLLPFRVLYFLADFLYCLLSQVIRYRRTVVMVNLKNSFPEKTDQELRSIEKKFYINLVDVMVETLKMASMSESSIQKRLYITNKELIQNFYDQGRPVMIVTAH